MTVSISESVVEEAALGWLGSLRYQVRRGPDIAPDTPEAERVSYGDVVLFGRLRAAIERLNNHIPSAAREESIRKVTRMESPSLVEENRRFHRMLTDGVGIEYQSEGRLVYDSVRLVDFEYPENNDWLAVNQFTVIERKHNRRPDIVIFVNGLPLAVLELKDPADESATLRRAYNQLQTYQRDIPVLFPYSQALVISDGPEARIGTMTSEWERFMPWRIVDGSELASSSMLELDVLINGVFDHRRFLDLMRHFIVFEVDGPTIDKKMAAYHQFHAVNKAVDSTIAAASHHGDRRAGVVWHTQGSGKSLSMVFYAGKIIGHPAMENPTLVVLTDRNDLDDQLFGTFAACHDLLRQTPEQAENRDHLRDLLHVASGGVVFTTIQKFLPDEKGGAYPLLSDRRNIIVIADEAHRSQYDFIDGFARHMRDALPNASFIGFTGTPIEATDRNTKAVFGDYIDVYDIQRAVDDQATVPIYYESRLAKLALSEDERPLLDPAFEDVTEGEEQARKEKLKSKWARMEAMVGAEKRVQLVAEDIVSHWEKRLDALDGKGMIVCMSRRIAVDLYAAVTALRPEWHDEDDEGGVLKVVMTGSAGDPLPWQQHIRNKPLRERLATRFKDPDDPLKLVIVRDMWLTGFDAPSLHTMYVDKPMQGHGLMQAIARVNRVFKDKPGGLVVDYLGLADKLREALASYTEGDRENAGIPQEQAVAVMMEKFEVVEVMLYHFDYAGNAQKRLQRIIPAMEYVLQLEDGKKRFMDAVTDLSKAFALAVPHPQALAIRNDLAFFQAVRARFIKSRSPGERDPEDLDSAVRQLVSHAITTGGVIDIFSEAGLKTPDISILSEEFLAEVRDMPQRNLALELLQRLLNDEIKRQAARNVVQARSFAEMLEQSLRRYQNRSIETAQVIAELIEMARALREAQSRGHDLGLSDDEVAFYDALAANESAVDVLGDETLRDLARELVKNVRASATIDWTVREGARAALRSMVKRLLRKYGYPPDKREAATKLVLEQAELLACDWAA
jgi:type I restriction enzyme R subunit